MPTTASSQRPSPAKPLPEPLDDVFRQLAAVREDAESLIAGLDSTGFHWSPGEGRWSIGQCLGHLATVDGAYGKRLERQIETAVARKRPLRGEAKPSKLGPFERWMVTSMEPPPSRRIPAPKGITPAPGLDMDTVVAGFRRSSDRVLASIEAGAHLDLQKIKVRSPIFPLLRLRASTVFRFLAAHDRRHLWQAWEVRRNAAFPG